MTAHRNPYVARAERRHPGSPEANPPRLPASEYGGSGGSGGSSGPPVATPLSQVQRRRREWLLPGLVPRADLTVLVGEEGIGKGLWWVHHVATLTREGHDVLLLAGTEDDPAMDLGPRLDVAGADDARVHVAGLDPTGDLRLVLADAAAFEDMVAALRPSLVVVDPWISHVRSSLQVKDTQQARQALDVLQGLARRHDTAVLAVTHTNRGDGSLRDRVGLTAALRATARVLVHAAEDPDDAGRLLVGVDKANGAARGPALSHRKVSADHVVGTVWRVEEGQVTDRTIREWDDLWRGERDGRRSPRWEEVKAAADGGLLTRQDVVEVYDGNEKAADKAIARWKQDGSLTSSSSGVYEVRR